MKESKAGLAAAIPINLFATVGINGHHWQRLEWGNPEI